MSSVFISYRRQTASGEARALFNDLVARLGESAVFMDVDSISLGRDFRSELHKTLAACDLMLVIIDKDWATATDERGRVRLEIAGDFVRMEIEAGLKRDIVITPILVKGAQMPPAEELPAEIRDLAYRNGFELSHNRWESDVREMIRRLGLVTPEPAMKIETTHLAATSGGVKVFGAEVSGTAGRTGRALAGILGLFILGAAVWLSLSNNMGVPTTTNASPPALTPTTKVVPETTTASPIPNERKPTSIPAAYTQGQLIVRGTWSVDLDLGVQAQDRADFFWEQFTDTKRAIVPKSGAAFYIVGLRNFDSVTYSDLQLYPYSTSIIDSSDALSNKIPTGTVVAYKTKDGRFGKFLIENYGYNLNVRWITYANKT